MRNLTHRLRQAMARDEYARKMSVGWSSGSDPPRRTLPVVVLILTFATGLVDAVSYLGLGQVFTGFQTGNIVVLGFALAGAEGFSVARPAVSLAMFFLGAVIGGRLAGRLSSRHRRWFALALMVEALLVALAAATAAGLAPDVLADLRVFVVIGLLGMAMGLRNATVRSLAAPAVTTTVLTSTITSLAADAGGVGQGLTRRAWQVATIAALLLGAVTGALLVQISLFLPLLLVAGLIAVAAISYVSPVILREYRRRRSRGDGDGRDRGAP